MTVFKQLGLIGLALILAPVMSFAQVVYLEAEFDDGVCYSGAGEVPNSNGLPLECGGEWSQGVDSGVGPAGATADIAIFNNLSNPPACDPPAALNSSVYIDPDHGARATSHGLHLEDENCGSTHANFHVTGAVATDSQVYWIDYSFKLNPVASGIADALGWLQVFDANGTEIVRVWHGLYVPDTEPEFRYRFFLTPDPGATLVSARNIAPTTIATEWRALVKVDPAADTQSHWLWREGNQIEGFQDGGEDVFGTPYQLMVPQDAPLDLVRFRTNSNNLVDFFVDEVRVSSDVTQTFPIDLEAVPSTLGNVKLRWTNLGTSESGFTLERSPAGAAQWTPVASPAAGSTQHVDLVGQLAEKFDYRLAAEFAGGTISPWTNIASAVPVYRNKPLVGWLNLDDFLPTDPLFDPSDPVNASVTTGSIQAALDSIARLIDGPHVLYIPNGEYVINSTLALWGTEGAQIIGESTDGVIIKWAGAVGIDPISTTVMFHAEGNRDALFRNITWDADCYDGTVAPPTECFVVAFDQSYCGNGANYNPECDTLTWGNPGNGFADNGSAHFDSVFKNAFIGLRIGHYQVQDSEFTVRRSRFINNFVGSSIEDFNALDIWYWDCWFEDNWVGISNDTDFARYRFDDTYRPGICTGAAGGSCFFNFPDCPTDETCHVPGYCTGGGAQVCLVSEDCPSGESCRFGKNSAGDFDVYRGRFLRSWFADLFARPTGQFTFRDSWSRDSALFFYGVGLTGSASNFALLNNLIEDETGPAIDIRNPGTTTLSVNQIFNDGVSPPVVMNGLRDLDLVALNNSYTVPVDPTDGIPELTDADGPYQLLRAARLRAYGDAHIAPPASGQDAFVIPDLPLVDDLLSGRDVFTVTDPALAQDVIDAALATGSQAIVHFPSGSYDLEQTLRLPSGSSLIVTGDGMWTRLNWVGDTPGPLLQIDSEDADRVVIQDLQFNQSGILVDKLTRNDRGALASRLRIAEGTGISVLVNETDTVRTDFVDYMAGGSVDINDVGGGTSVDQVGFQVRVGSDPLDPVDKKGTGFYSGVATGNGWDFDVVNDAAGAKVLVADTYMEDSRHYLRVRGQGGPGQVEVHGGKLAPIVPLEDPTIDEPGIDPGILAEETATILIDGYNGNLSLMQSLFFVQPPASLPCCSDNVASEYGARVKVEGSEPVDIQFVGTMLRHHAVPVEYDFSDGGSGILANVNFLRIGGKHANPSATPIDDGRVQNGVPEVFVPLSEDVRSELETALELRLTMPLPHYYDEFSAPDDYKVILDNVFVWGAADYSIVLTGGESCFSGADCTEGASCAMPSCDLGDLPAGVPGHCRYTLDDSVCDDGIFCNGVETCSPSGCVPGVDPCQGGPCDEGLDVCVCDDDGTCETGEDCGNCSGDCISGSLGSCGNGVCEPGEDCTTCSDCRGKQNGKFSNRYCCSGTPGGQGGDNPVDCGDSRCSSVGFQCSSSVGSYCCGDGSCDSSAEDEANCAVDCSAGCSVPADCDDFNDCTTDDCVGSVCQYTPAADNSSCNGGSGICCSGSCDTAVCSVNADCDDGDSCSTDTCTNGGTCAAACDNSFPACDPNVSDGCCGPSCDQSNDIDCACVPTHNKEKGPRCSDGIDNDCDGLTDGDDPDC